MRRFVCIILTLLMLLSGCSTALNNIKEPVEFYYLRDCNKPDDYKVYFSEGPFASEIREASGHRNDLYYLLSIYLRGPLDSGLISPFPAGCKVVKAHQDGRKLAVSLNTAFAELEDMDLTVACVCLAKTCMELANVDSVHIEVRDSNNKIIFTNTITSGSLLLEEISSPPTEPTAEIQ